MEWEFCYHEDGDYLEIMVCGSLSHGELNKMAVERWDELRRLNCKKVLFDFTQITGMLGTVDIYKRPEESEKSGVLRTNHTAAVVPDIYWKDFEFMETVYQNRGFDLHLFHKKEDAINYLKQTVSRPPA